MAIVGGVNVGRVRAMAGILAERVRQVRVEGFAPEADDQYTKGELARAAAAYAASGSVPEAERGPSAHLLPFHWPWNWSSTWWKPQNPRRDLEKAGALILAELERLHRKEGTQGTAPDPLEEMANFLRAQGWVCAPPVDPEAAIPEPEVGQVWRSPKPRVEPRTVVRIGTHRSYPWAGDKCVSFTTPSRQAGELGQATLSPETWRRWVQKSGARPERLP